MHTKIITNCPLGPGGEKPPVVNEGDTTDSWMTFIDGHDYPQADVRRVRCRLLRAFAGFMVRRTGFAPMPRAYRRVARRGAAKPVTTGGDDADPDSAAPIRRASSSRWLGQGVHHGG